MEIIIDKNNPVLVRYQEGNILLDYKPTTIKQLENMTLDELATYLKDSVTY
jgi:hypothetical protein